jgi:phosphoglycerate dehydrogenase-like enzyme
VLVSMPHDFSERLLGPVPSGVTIDVWTGEQDPLPGREHVEFFVPSPQPATYAATLRALPTMPNLRVVQLLSAGAEWIAGQVPEPAILCNARGAHSAATAEWILTAILSSLRQFSTFHDRQLAGRWQPKSTDELTGKHVAIVGYGSIGVAVEQRIAPFGVTVARVASRARPGVLAMTEIEAVLADADIVVILVPLTASTRGLVDEKFLSRMKPGALLVNAARGPIVDTDALVGHLEQGRIRAALDTVHPEPLPEGHRLWQAPGLLLTPHVAGSTTSIMPRTYSLVAAQLRRYVAGEPLENVIADY